MKYMTASKGKKKSWLLSLSTSRSVIPPPTGTVPPAHGDQDVGARGAARDPASLSPQQCVVPVQRRPRGQPIDAQQHLLLVWGAGAVQHGYLHGSHDFGKADNISVRIYGTKTVSRKETRVWGGNPWKWYSWVWDVVNFNPKSNFQFSLFLHNLKALYKACRSSSNKDERQI